MVDNLTGKNGYVLGCRLDMVPPVVLAPPMFEIGGRLVVLSWQTLAFPLVAEYLYEVEGLGV